MDTQVAPKKHPWKRSEVLTGIGVAIALLALLWALYSWYVGPPGKADIVLFIADQSDKPRIDVTLVGPSGSSVSPDGRGMANVPRSWAGKILSVRDRADWRELATIRLLDTGAEVQKITLP